MMFIVIAKVVAVNFDNKETGSDLKERDESCLQLRFFSLRGRVLEDTAMSL